MLLIVLMNLWISANSTGANNYQLLAYNSARAMTTQAAALASGYLVDKNEALLQKIVDNLAADPFIADATFYDKSGITLFTSQLSQTATARFNNSTDYVKASEKAVVVDLEVAEHRVGFLRVTYIEKQAVARAQEAHGNVMKQSLLMVLLASIMGFLLTRAFSRFNRMSYRIDKSAEAHQPESQPDNRPS